MARSELVLVTGSAGRIGQAIVTEFNKQGIPTRGFDLVATPSLDDAMVGNLQDPDALAGAMDGVGTLIHLAATPDDVEDFVGTMVPNNIVGVYNVFEAARKAGVGRMILASSGQTVWGRRVTGPWPIQVTDPPTPRYWYAATKLFLEAAGRAYADAHQMEVIAARIGWLPRSVDQVKEIVELDWAKDVYFSPNDAGRFFVCAVRAKLKSNYVVVFATSKPAKLMRNDLEPAKELLGYVPADTWPEGVELPGD